MICFYSLMYCLILLFFLHSKKEIPHYNYVMHTAHCARNITLCKNCKEPVPKTQFEEHTKKCQTKQVIVSKPTTPPAELEKSDYYRKQKAIQDKKIADRKERYFERHEKFLDAGQKIGRATSNNGVVEKETLLKPCKYCELELRKGDLEEHENYCGARTDRCQECGEIVMFKYRQLHEDTNHGFLKLSDGKQFFFLLRMKLFFFSFCNKITSRTGPKTFLGFKHNSY